MRILFIFSFLCLILISSCSLTRNENENLEDLEFGYIPLPSKDMAERSNTSLEVLHRGFGVYMRHCGTCHDHIFPDELQKDDWHVVTPKMSWNAGITNTEQKALLKYLIGATSEPDFPSELVTESGERIPFLPYGSKPE